MRYTKELFVLILQLAVFYLFPLFSEPFGPMGMVYVIIFLTFMLSALLGLLSRNAIKYCIDSLLFLLCDYIIPHHEPHFRDKVTKVRKNSRQIYRQL